MRVKIIGYTPINADGNPHRPHKSGYSWQINMTNPPRIYSTKSRAEGQSPVGEARQVLMVLDDVTEEDITTSFPQ